MVQLFVQSKLNIASISAHDSKLAELASSWDLLAEEQKKAILLQVTTFVTQNFERAR